MSVVSYPSNKQLSTHFNSSEFKCPHCNSVKLSTKLIDKLEELFSTLNASKCIISSGYRCPYYDKQQNGFAGRHSEGLACDCCYYDKQGKPIIKIYCIDYEEIENIDLSLSHCKEYAVANVTALAK